MACTQSVGSPSSPNPPISLSFSCPPPMLDMWRRSGFLELALSAWTRVRYKPVSLCPFERWWQRFTRGLVFPLTTSCPRKQGESSALSPGAPICIPLLFCQESSHSSSLYLWKLWPQRCGFPFFFLGFCFCCTGTYRVSWVRGEVPVFSVSVVMQRRWCAASWLSGKNDNHSADWASVLMRHLLAWGRLSLEVVVDLLFLGF